MVHLHKDERPFVSTPISEQLRGFKPDNITVNLESLTKAFEIWEEDARAGRCLDKSALAVLTVKEVSAQRSETLMNYLTTGNSDGI